MVSIRIGYLALAVLAVFFLAGIAAVIILDSDFGNLDVKTVAIPDGDLEISGLLYRPKAATAQKPLPAIILVHGISSSKQSMSNIALELARRDFIALSIDVVGHGRSGGKLEATGDLSLGTLAAVRYIEAQPYVDASSIALVGHSLGAGAIRAAVTVRERINATVLIAGGFGEMVADQAYGVLNSTFPKNLLVAIGRQDILFDLSQVTKEWLPPVFGVSLEVVPNRLYGDFYLGTARKLITPSTTHLLEPLDPNIVSETVIWLNKALKSEYVGQQLEESTIYLYREVAMLFSVFVFVGLIFPVSLHILPIEFPDESKVKTKYGFLVDWKITVIWGALSTMLFFPMFFLGFTVPFPPVLFGSSIAWWLLVVAITGLLLLLFVLPKFSNVKLKISLIIEESFTRRGVTAPVALFLLLYLIVYLMELLLDVNLWIFVPVFRVLHPTTRIPVFFIFIPFFLVFFFVEGMYFYTLRRTSEKTGFLSQAFAMSKIIGIKIAPYLAIMCIQYIPMFTLEVKILPSSLGFLIEFLPLLTVQFTISTICSWWFHRMTSSIGTGAIFNTLLFAWISAGAFPFGTFH